jgi:hypothetical protein
MAARAERARIEALLRVKKLEVTLMDGSPWNWRTAGAGADDLASTGVPSIDAALGGGLRRGHLSEIIGSRSSGRTAVLCQALASAV